jgi:hypothetical protein
MKSQSPDTTVEAEKVQIDLIRKASICKRISVARSLSQTTMYLARRAIQRANPALSEREVDLAFVEKHYGKKLAENLRLYMKSKRL